MANHKSAAKRARQTIRKQAVNSSRKSKVKTNEKTLAQAIKAKDVSQLPTLLKAYMAQIMKAAKAGALKKETASRKIARISKQISSLVK